MPDPALPAIAELARLPQWVCWRYVDRRVRDGATVRTKVPIDARRGGPASVTDRRTWAPYALAVEARLHLGCDGIGFVLTAGDPYVGTDLDDCLGADGTVSPWAQRIVDELRSYSEVTPSGKGLHVFVRGGLPPAGRKRGDVELYDSGRFLTVTGRHLPGTPPTIEHRPEPLRALHARLFPPAPAPPAGDGRGAAAPPTTLEDHDLLERAFSAKNGATFRQLWAGDWGAYPSQSEADQALCRMLAFWAGGDAGRVDRLFRQSGLWRPKWDERRGARTYGEGTIERALPGRVHEQRMPPRAEGHPSGHVPAGDPAEGSPPRSATAVGARAEPAESLTAPRTAATAPEGAHGGLAAVGPEPAPPTDEAAGPSPAAEGSREPGEGTPILSEQPDRPPPAGLLPMLLWLLARLLGHVSALQQENARLRERLAASERDAAQLQEERSLAFQIILRPDLPPSERIALLGTINYHASHASRGCVDEDGFAHVSPPEVANSLGLPARTYSRQLKDLAGAGFLERRLTTERVRIVDRETGEIREAPRNRLAIRPSGVTSLRPRAANPVGDRADAGDDPSCQNGMMADRDVPRLADVLRAAARVVPPERPPPAGEELRCPDHPAAQPSVTTRRMEMAVETAACPVCEKVLDRRTIRRPLPPGPPVGPAAGPSDGEAPARPSDGPGDRAGPIMPKWHDGPPARDGGWAGVGLLSRATGPPAVPPEALSVSPAGPAEALAVPPGPGDPRPVTDRPGHPPPAGAIAGERCSWSGCGAPLMPWRSDEMAPGWDVTACAAGHRAYRPRD